jgi:hypothetical protein
MPDNYGKAWYATADMCLLFRVRARILVACEFVLHER